MEPSIPFHTLIKLVDSEDITKEKNRPFELPLEINIATSKLESQNSSAETYDPSPEGMCTQTIDLNNKSVPQFRNYSKYCHKSRHSISICFHKQREDEKENGVFTLDRNHLWNPSINT